MEENQGVWQSYKHFEKEGCITLSILTGQGDTDLPHSLVWVIHSQRGSQKGTQRGDQYLRRNSLEIYKGHLLAKCLAYSGSK